MKCFGCGEENEIKVTAVGLDRADLDQGCWFCSPACAVKYVRELPADDPLPRGLPMLGTPWSVIEVTTFHLDPEDERQIKEMLSQHVVGYEKQLMLMGLTIKPLSEPPADEPHVTGG